MTNAEQRLYDINLGGCWSAPTLNALGEALDGLNGSLRRLIQAEGWTGAAADAAMERFERMIRHYTTVHDCATQIQESADVANDALTRAIAKAKNLPSAAVPAEFYDLVKNAEEAGHQMVKPFPDYVEVPLDHAIDFIAGIFGGNRNKAAEEALKTLTAELEDASRTLPELTDTLTTVGRQINFDSESDDSSSSPVPEHGGGSSGPILPPSRWPVGQLPDPAPGRIPEYRLGPDMPFLPGDVDLPDRDRPGMNVDDGGPGVYDDPYGPPGSHLGDSPTGWSRGRGLAAGVMGGTTALGSAAALRYGAGGASSAPTSGGMSSAGRGLLGAGTSTGGRGLLGASSNTPVTGAPGAAGGGGSRMAMMGAGGMGTGGGDKKDKKTTTSGLMAPKLEDDEPEFRPIHPGARAGSRDE